MAQRKVVLQDGTDNVICAVPMGCSNLSAEFFRFLKKKKEISTKK